MIKYGDYDLLAALWRAVRYGLRRPAAIIVLAGAAVILVSPSLFGYVTVTHPGTGQADQSSGGIVVGAMFAILPALLGTLMLFTRPTLWQGVSGLAIGMATVQVHVLGLLIVLAPRALLVLPPESEDQFELQRGFWLLLAGCVTIFIGGIVSLVRSGEG